MVDQREFLETIRSIFAEVLGCDVNDVEDSSDFFALGGDSVGVMKIANKAREKGLVSLTIPAVYEQPVLSQLVSWCASQDEAGKSPGVESASSQDMTQTQVVHLRNSGAQYDRGTANDANEKANMTTILGHWKLINDCVAQLEIAPEEIDDIYPTFSRQISLLPILFEIDFAVEVGSEEPVMTAIERLHQSNPVLRTRLFRHNDTVQQVVVKEKISWTREHGSLEEYRRCNKIQQARMGGVLSRFALVVDGKDAHIMWTLSHAITDRFSRATLIDRVFKYWENPKAILSTPPSVRAVVDWTRDRGRREAGLAFWGRRLEGLQSVGHLHHSRLTAKAENLTLIEKFMAAPSSPIPGVTYPIICHVALALCLARASKLTDVCFLTVTSGRQVPDMDLSSVTGPLACQTPFRLTMDNHKQPLKEFLEEVQRIVVAGFAHEHMGADAMQQKFGVQGLQQCIFNYSGDIRAPSLEFVRETEKGTQETMKVTTPGLYNMFDPCFSAYIGIQPKGDDQKKIVAVYDPYVAPTEKMSFLVDECIRTIRQLTQSAPWDDLTVGDVWLDTPAEEKTTVRPPMISDRCATHDTESPKTLCNILSDNSNVMSVIVPQGEQKKFLGPDQLRYYIQDFQTQLADLSLPVSSSIILAFSNSAEFIVAFLGITWSRYVVAPINPALKEGEIDFYTKDIDARLVLLPRGSYDANSAAAISAKKNEITVAECYFQGSNIVLNVKQQADHVAEQDFSKRRDDNAREDDVALILHTSGTTGRPKAVPLTHKNLYTSATNVCRTYNLTSDDRTVLIMPLYHIHGIVAGFLSTLLSGGTIILPPKLTSSFWTHFTEYKATWYTATPTMHHVILQFDMPFSGNKPKARFIRSCSSALSPALLHRLENEFGCPVLESYAMTEASHLMTSNPLPPALHLPGCVGIPQGIELQIRTQHGERVEQGAEGEVCIRGENVTSGYLNNPDANKSSFFEDGFFRTGDQGKLDVDGYLTLTGRLKEVINKGGEKISPVELDNVLSEHEDVDEAVCFAIDDDVYGQDVGATIRPKKGSQVDVRVLRKWIAERVAPHKIPKKIWILDEIPKTATGKVQRKLVAEKVKDM